MVYPDDSLTNHEKARQVRAFYRVIFDLERAPTGRKRAADRLTTRYRHHL